MSPAPKSNPYPRRLERARELAGLYPFARQILEIYQEIAAFQGEVYDRGRLLPGGTEELRGRVARVNAEAAKDVALLERAVAQALAEGEPAGAAGEPHTVCPACGSRPVVGVLREQAHGARRSLICAGCSTEWDFPRVACAGCGYSELEIYISEQITNVRLEVCPECRVYLKTVDLTRNALAVPIVDEIATIPLDLWAQERGYRKLEVNLLGL